MRKLITAVFLLLLVGCSSINHWKNEVPDPEPLPVVVKNMCDGGAGSGALVGSIVYTAYHVVEDCPFAIVFNDDLNFGSIAIIVAFDPEMDTARLSFSDKEGPSVEIAKPKVGPVCTHNAFPRNEKKCGNIVKIERGRWGLYVDFKVVPGNSGSPLYQDGKLVGVVTARWPWRGSSLI